MRRLLIIATLSITAASFALGQSANTTASKATDPVSDAEQAVLQVTNEWLEAEGRHDRVALDRIIAPEFVGTAPGGNFVYKNDIVPTDGTRAGGMTMTARDLKARIFGDTAVVTGRGLPKAQERGELRLTLVYLKRQNRWQMVAGHISVVPER
jgi:ketosteroid isomerase-like protein